MEQRNSESWELATLLAPVHLSSSLVNRKCSSCHRRVQSPTRELEGQRERQKSRMETCEHCGKTVRILKYFQLRVRVLLCVASTGS